MEQILEGKVESLRSDPDEDREGYGEWMKDIK